MNICLNCGKEFNISISKKFCSKHCMCAYKHDYGKIWECRICKEKFTSRRKLQKHRKDNHNINHAWNYGLNSKNSEIIRKTAEKIKDMYKCGKLISPLKGKKINPDVRQKISQTMSKINSIKDFNCGRPEVKWFYIKNINNIEYCVRGTWEYNVAKILNEHNINWIRNHCIKYKINNIIKTYNPDFYLPKEDIYIEVKGWFKKDDIIKMNCVQSQYPNYKIYFINDKYYHKFKNKEIFLEECMLYVNNEKFKSEQKKS